MDSNILLNIALHLDDDTFLDYIKVFPYIINICRHFGLIFDINDNNHDFKMEISLYKSIDISIYERIIKLIKKNIKYDILNIVYGSTFTMFNLINLNKINLLQNIKNIKNNKSIACRQPIIQLYFKPSPNIFIENKVKVLILTINNYSIKIPHYNIYHTKQIINCNI